MKKTHIIIHHSATTDRVTLKDFDAIKRYHMSYAIDGYIVTKEEFERREQLKDGKLFKLSWKDIGYFAVLEYENGKPIWTQGRGLNEEEAHCYQQNMNNLSLGICVVGNYDVEDLGQEMLHLLVDFVSSLILDYSTLSLDRIQKHHEYEPHKTCPGIKFPWELFLQQTKSRYIKKRALRTYLRIIGKDKIFVRDQIKE